ncbi:MAG: lytic transglycosylase domain-containing protein [Endozoicomonas sp.]|uniref:lytic transglycosylase domain-containing protein n=1 Tax=Endozoicomonas sp. TaxID=1892382 RepID=UPI003D9AB7D1
MALTLLLSPVTGWSQQKVDEGLRIYLEEALSTTESFFDRFEAEVWLVDMSNRLKPFMKHQDPRQRLELLKKIHKKATDAKLSPELVLALIQTESSFDRFAVSSAGAQGLMQIMPFWKDVIGRPQDNLTDIETNLKYGSHILSYYLEKEKGNLTRALARYNGSLGKTWYPERVYKNWDRHWRND